MEIAGAKDGLSTSSDLSPGGGYLDEIPDSHIICQLPSNPGAEPKVSRRPEALQKKKGVYSHDPILDRNPDKIWQFLVSNLKPPRLCVHITGTHQPRKCDGRIHKSRGTDFTFKITVPVTDPWSQLYAHPDGAVIKEFETNCADTIEGPTLRKTVKEYTSSRNQFKELRMRKIVVWDIARVEKLIQNFVRSVGYRERVYVEFLMEDDLVVVLAPNKCLRLGSRAEDSDLVRCLCCISCLSIVFRPAWYIAHKLMDRLTCEYRTTQSPDQFLSANSSVIRSNVQRYLKSRRPDDLIRFRILYGLV